MRTHGNRDNTTVFFNGDGYYYHQKESLAHEYSYRCIHWYKGCRGRARSNLDEGRTNFRTVAEHTDLVGVCQANVNHVRSLELRRGIEEACLRGGTRSMMTTIRQEMTR